MSDLLSIADLEDLSGYKKPVLIIKWLKLNNIPFLTAKTGLPKVHKDALAYSMGAKIEPSKSALKNNRIKPNFTNMDN